MLQKISLVFFYFFARLFIKGGNLPATKKKITVKYTGSTPVISTGMKLLESKENQMTLSLDPHILPVSSAIALLASQTELLDVSVADISTEEVVAALYKEYHI